MPLHSPPQKNKAEDRNISVHAYDGGSVFVAEPSICFWFTLIVQWMYLANLYKFYE